MALGIIGHKSGMTRVFTDSGTSIAITVIQVPSNRVTQIKTEAIDGYNAVQITSGSRKVSRVNKPLAGHFIKANTEAGQVIKEFRCDTKELEQHTQGDALDLLSFADGQMVDVTATSKGKGFQGGIKRWNFSTQPASHGTSLSHRSNGSIGLCQTPGRVFKGKKMSGHMGNQRVTTQNLEIIRVDKERNLLLIKGAVPGAAGGLVTVRPAVKKLC